jgi:hypothetical protein
MFANKNLVMGSYEMYLKRKDDIKKKLKSIKFDRMESTRQMWAIGNALKISGTSVDNYVKGRIKDGYMAEAIYSEYLKMKGKNGSLESK